mgnify:CR=1 FL=1
MSQNGVRGDTQVDQPRKEDEAERRERGEEREERREKRRERREEREDYFSNFVWCVG